MPLLWSLDGLGLTGYNHGVPTELQDEPKLRTRTRANLYLTHGGSRSFTRCFYNIRLE